MTKPIIVINLKANRYDGLSTMALSAYLKMTGNANFINPQPTLAALETARLELVDATTNWGTPGHRGSHLDFVKLTDKAQRVHSMLTLLGKWCMSTIDPDTSYEDQTIVLASAGFPLKRAKSPQGMLAMVQNLRRVMPRNLNLDYVKLRWQKPLAVYTNTNVKSYKIFRNTSADFFSAACIDAVPSTIFIDKPGEGSWFYWVVPVNNKGDGVTSEFVKVNMAPSIF